MVVMSTSSDTTCCSEWRVNHVIVWPSTSACTKNKTNPSIHSIQL